MKVYDTKEREIIFEPSFKFAGNPNIIIAVKAFGLKATVQVSSWLRLLSLKAQEIVPGGIYVVEGQSVGFIYLFIYFSEFFSSKVFEWFENILEHDNAWIWPCSL